MKTTETYRESERRQATVVFADITGFTSMSERADPEEVNTVINRCFEMLETVVRSHGGHVDKYIGDCIMALFGVPEAIESAPKQAINAAIEMRNRLREFNEDPKLRFPIGLHVGINTGLVIAGEVGGSVKRDFSVIGDSVNLASRLKDASPDGAIYIGTDTYRATRNEFEFRKIGNRKLKGKELPVSIYEVLSVEEHLHRPKAVGSDRMIASELVGRSEELGLLRGAIEDLSKGRGGIINLTGDAGLGKSRLMAEALRSGAVEEITCLEGRSLSIGQSLRFHPFVDLLKGWAHITTEDSEERAFEKLEAGVTELFGSDAGEVLPFVATVMGLRPTAEHSGPGSDIDGEHMEKMILKSLRELFERMAERRPLMLVFEDVHWADQSSVKLLEPLLKLATTARVLFVLALRPHHSPSAARLMEVTGTRFPRHLTEIALKPLETKDCDRLIENLLNIDALPYTTRTIIARKAEGNPFYIEEVIRALVDQGVIEHRHGAFRVTAKIDSVQIPGTIQEVIMARVDRLPDQPKQLLQIGSVIGRSFQHRLLAELWPQADQLQLALGYLKRSQLLEERRAGDDVGYSFKHAVAQETVYESILQKTRKELHLRVAETIESLFAERLSDFYGMLAYHHSRAENLEKAEEFLFKAGDEAARSAAASEALSYFQEASKLFFTLYGAKGDPGKKALLEKSIGLALLNTGKMTESIEHFDAALEYLGERVPKTTLARGLWLPVDLSGLLYYLYAPGLLRRRPRARDRDREALEIRYNRARAQLTTDPRRYFFDTISSLKRLGQTDPKRIEQACGMYAGGAALFAYSGLPFRIGKRFLDVSERVVRENNVRDQFVVRSMRFVHEYLKGRWDDEFAIPADLVDEALRHGQIFDVFVYLSLNAERRAYRGEFEDAKREIEALERLTEVYGFEHARSSEYAMRAILCVEQRRFEPAIDALTLYYANQHEEFFNLFALGTKAKVEILAEDRAAAAETLTEAEALVRKLGNVLSVYHFSVFAVSRLLYDVTTLEEAGAAAGGSRSFVGQARRNARRAVSIAKKVASARPEVYRLAGRLSWALGKRERARRWWTRSLEAAERLGTRPELARTCTEIGRRLSGSESAPVAGLEPAQHLERARQIFSELDLAWDLERLTGTPAPEPTRALGS